MLVIINRNMIANQTVRKRKNRDLFYTLLLYYGNFFVTFFDVVFVIFVDTIFIADIISSNTITEFSVILFKYLSISQINVLRFKL